MTKSVLTLLGGLTWALGSCQQTTPATSEPAAAAPPETAKPDTSATVAASQPASAQTETEARAAVGRFIQTLPNAARYVADSARVNDNGPTWQVLVPRTDWAKRMPNRAHFEVVKATGTVRTAPVK